MSSSNRAFQELHTTYFTSQYFSYDVQIKHLAFNLHSYFIFKLSRVKCRKLLCELAAAMKVNLSKKLLKRSQSLN